MNQKILEVQSLRKYYGRQDNVTKALKYIYMITVMKISDRHLLELVQSRRDEQNKEDFMKKIVIVEDDAFMREELESIFQKENYVVSCITCFQNTAEAILMESPNLVLLDVNLPGATGFEICKVKIWLLFLLLTDVLFGTFLWLVDANSFSALLGAMVLGSLVLFSAALFYVCRRENERQKAVQEFLENPDQADGG